MHRNHLYHEHRGRYGYRRITAELRNEGLVINHKTALRLMLECGIKCRVRLRKYRSYEGETGHTADNLLRRDFLATAPNRKWATDITGFSLFGKKLYLSPIMDLYNREIVSYAISERPTFQMAMQMLDKAFTRLPDGEDLILHS